jgi:hypothetical protein
MKYSSVWLVFLLVSSTPLFAQRGGRADALQNYLGLNRNPRLLLQIKIDKNRVYFRASDLRKKTHSVVTISDPATPHKYEGVSIEQLIPARALNHESESLEVLSDHKKKVLFLCTNVDFRTPPIVADTVDGKKRIGYVPYDFVRQTREGFAGPLQNVTMIEVKSSGDLG